MRWWTCLNVGEVLIVMLSLPFALAGRVLFMALADLPEPIMEGAVERVRPKIMTALATMLGFLHLLIGHGAGGTVMGRIATPMIGGDGTLHRPHPHRDPCHLFSVEGYSGPEGPASAC